METILDEVILFEEGASGLSAVATNGQIVPAATKTSRGIKTAIPITLAPGEHARYHLRISGAFAAEITPSIVSESLFVRWSATFGYVSVALFSFIVFRHIETRTHRFYTL